MIREEDDFGGRGDRRQPARLCAWPAKTSAHPGTGLVVERIVIQALGRWVYVRCRHDRIVRHDIESVANYVHLRKLADSPEQLATEGLKFLKSVYLQSLAA
jgi:hypothetical protein